MLNNQETLLRVEHLCQYFPMEGGELKAVDDVSFEIQKGEVFGPVSYTHLDVYKRQLPEYRQSYTRTSSPMHQLPKNLS